jgi:O-antigen/teichoic acid export membrane protein
MTAFPLLLGLGQTFKWTVEATWRQMLLTALVLLIVPQPSLIPALVALALHEFIFAALGLYWVRTYVASPKSTVYGHATADTGLGTVDVLRFGLGFSLANFSLVLLFRLGPILVVRLGGSPPEAGFFDLALGGWLVVYTLFERAALALVPLLTQMEMEGRKADAQVWAGRFVRYGSVAAVLAAGGMWAAARPLAPMLFGAGFAPAADAIRAMGFALLPLPTSWAAEMLSTVEKQPGRKARAALIGLGVLLGAAAAMRTPGAPGVALAFGAALAAYALGFGTAFGRAVRAGGVRAAAALGLGILFAPFLYFSFSSLFLALAAWLAVALVYLLLTMGPFGRLAA